MSGAAQSARALKQEEVAISAEPPSDGAGKNCNL